MTIGPAGHPGPDQLDELIDLGADAPADVRSHVDRCPHCQGQVDDARHVRSLLADARDTTPMPEILAERIATALVTEGGYRVSGGVLPHLQVHFDDRPPVFDVPLPVLDVPVPGGTRPERSDNVTPLRRRRRPLLLWAGAAAAAVLTLGIGGGLVTGQFTQVSGSTSAADGAAAPAPPAAAGDDQAMERAIPSDILPGGDDLGDLDPSSLPGVVTDSGAGDEGWGAVGAACAAKLGLPEDTPRYTARWNGSDALVFVTQLEHAKQVTVVDAACRAGDGGGFRYDTTTEP